MEKAVPKALIEPARSKKDVPLPADAFLVFTAEDMKLMKAQWASCRRAQRLFLSDVILCTGDGPPAALVGPLIGAPQAVLVLEKMIALGVRRVIAYGWCGSLQPQVAIGHVVLPEAVHSEEGTSAHYPIPGAPGPSPELFRRLEAALRSDPHLTVHKGSVWSTDAPYRETEEKVRFFQERGVLGVDMEMSALFTAAAFRGIDLAGVLVVSDDLSRLTWRHGFRDPQFQETRNRLPERLRRLF
ncbi:MAG: nucleoside phosphorylase [Desulfosoma sp.]